MYFHSRSRTQVLQFQQIARIQLQAPTKWQNPFSDKILIISVNERKENILESADGFTVSIKWRFDTESARSQRDAL